MFNLHLGLSARERQQQVGLLVAVARSSPDSPPTVPCIVGGDFNDWRSLVGPSSTDVLGFRSATDGSPGARGALKTYPSFFPQGPLDRIYFRGRPSPAGRPPLPPACLCRVASDHLPLIADLELLA